MPEEFRLPKLRDILAFDHVFDSAEGNLYCWGIQKQYISGLAYLVCLEKRGINIHNLPSWRNFPTWDKVEVLNWKVRGDWHTQPPKNALKFWANEIREIHANPVHRDMLLKLYTENYPLVRARPEMERRALKFIETIEGEINS